MRSRTVLLSVFVCMLALWAGATSSVKVIPQPAEISVGEGYCALGKPLTVAAADKNAVSLAAEIVRTLDRQSVKAKKASASRALVSVKADPELGAEQYRLRVTPGGITVTASTETGAFYAAQTLAQLVATAGPEGIAACEINDYPRMAYRGLMLDVVRCYVPVSELKRFVDVAARLKINNLHLHLTDDNGWRLEIKKYPKLTEVGAWRVDRPERFPGRLNQRSKDEPTPIGGFYTRKEMRELVDYAARRHVNIIPEIEMPAHSAAAIASYPELACPVNDRFVGVFPGIGGKDASIIMCAGNDKVIDFYKDVLDEVMDIFPSPYIHLGGDEASKTLWEKCQLCRKRIADENLKDCEELQAWFMDSINHYVRSKGRTAIGWDEVTYGDPKEDMVIIGWQGDGSTAVNDSRRSGRKFIMSPAKTMYLIRYQGPQWFEPWTYFGNNRMKEIYNYEPTDSTWTPELESSLLGIQGSLWSEFCQSASDMQYLVFPRLMAVADMAWRPKGTSDWPAFVSNLDAFLKNPDLDGLNYARSMFNIQHTVRPSGDGTVEVSLECERPDAVITYSMDDSTFHRTYAGPLKIGGPACVYASAFVDGRRPGRTLKLPLRFNEATGRKVTAPACNNGLQYVLTNGLRGSSRNSDFEWAGWWNAPAEFTVDLGSVIDVREVSLGTLVNSDICIAAPHRILLYTSPDGKAFTLASDVKVPEALTFAHPEKIEDIELFSGNARARYLKVVALNPGGIPDGMAREGAPTWMYFDELTVR